MNVLVDFDDSFTFNLKQYLEHANLIITIVHWRDFLSLDFTRVKTITLGPGPGHPREYDQIRYQLKTIINNKKIKLFGVCLGHQIICELLGFKIENLNCPIHGLSRKIYLNSHFQSYFGVEEVNVQFYNSLFVSKDSQHTATEFMHTQEFSQMLVMCITKNTLSMQFHPESIGSSSTLKGVKKFFK